MNNLLKIFAFLFVGVLIYSCDKEDEAVKNDENNFEITGFYLENEISKRSVTVTDDTVYLKSVSGKFSELGDDSKIVNARLAFSFSKGAKVTFNNEEFTDQVELDLKRDNNAYKKYTFKVESETGKSKDYELEFKYDLSDGFKINNFYLDGDDDKQSLEYSVKDEDVTVYLKSVKDEFDELSHVSKLQKAKLVFSVSDATDLTVSGGAAGYTRDKDTLKNIDIREGKTYTFSVKEKNGGSYSKDYKVKFLYFLVSKYIGKYEVPKSQNSDVEVDGSSAAIDFSKHIKFSLDISVEDKKAKKIKAVLNFYRAQITSGDPDWVMFNHHATINMKEASGSYVIDSLGLKSDKVIRDVSKTGMTKDGMKKYINDTVPNLVKYVLGKANASILALMELKNDVWVLKTAGETFVDGLSDADRKITYKLSFVKPEAGKKSPSGAPDAANNKYQAYTHKSGNDYKIKVKVPFELSGVALGSQSLTNPIKVYITVDAKNM